MRIESAMNALRQGKKVKRKAWKDSFLTLGAVDFFDEFYIIKIHREKHNAMKYIFTKSDVIARDWEVLKSENDNCDKERIYT